MAVNRVSGLILPASTKYLVDDVIGKHQIQLLTPIVLAVLARDGGAGADFVYADAAVVEIGAEDDRGFAEAGAGAYRAGCRFRFTTRTRRGALVSRIMSDVEGVRNLIGTGLVEFVGGLMTGVLALVFLLRISVTMTAIAFSVLLVFGVALNRAFETIRPIFRARPKITAEVTGQADRIAGRRAGGEGLSRGRARGEDFFGRRAAAAGQRVENADGDFAYESVGLGADGAGERGGDVHGRAPDSGGHDDAGNFSDVHDFFGVAGGAGVSDRGDWHADYRSDYRTGAHARNSG